MEDMENSEEAAGLMEMMEQKSIKIQHVAGVIDQLEIERLRRLIFRSTKGKSYMYIQEFDDDDEGESTKKRSVYIIVFWDGDTIREKIQKICDSFSGQRYDLPEQNQITPQIEKTKNAIHDARNVYQKTKNSLRDQLVQFDKIEGDGEQGGQGRKDSSTIFIYKMFLAKEKALYTNLNLCKWQSQNFIGYFWAPLELENII